jgi:outer membrane protein insertion porin family
MNRLRVRPAYPQFGPRLPSYTRHWLPLWFLVLGFATGARASPGFQAWGKIVQSIQLHTDAQLVLSDFTGDVAQKVGAPLDRSRVSETLKNLYATGCFRTLRAEVEEEKGGVNLILAGEAQFFVGSVQVKEQGKALSASALASGARLSLGQPLSSADLEAARQRILSLLASEGYHRSGVTVGLERNPMDQVANVVIAVIPGSHSTLSRVVFRGKTIVPPTRLAALAGWKKGIHLTSAKITRGLSEIQNALAKRESWAAAITLQNRIYHSKENTETLEVKINPGPHVRVHVEGARISSSELKKLLPVYQDGLTDDLSLEAGRENIADYFERRGYFSVDVQWRRITHPGATDITYAVDLGPQSIFEGYEFHGNRSVPAQQLSQLVTLRGPSFPSHTHGVFSQRILDHDVKALVTYYQSQGFLAVRVTPERVRKPGTLSIIFKIEEGPRTTVSDVLIRGVDPETRRQLLAVLQETPTRSYSPGLVVKDRDAMLAYLANHGFSSAVVTPRVSRNARDKVNIDYDVAPGPQETVGRVVVIGNRYAHTALIRHALTFRVGQPLSQSRLFESQRRLYNLGLFDAVQISPENPGGKQTDKTILVNVEEAERWTLGYGFGLDVQRLNGNQPTGQLGASPRLSLDVTRIGVGGRDQTFSLRGRLSDLETGGEASYLIPNLFNHPKWSLHLDALADRTRDVLTFTSTIEQASLTLERQFSPSTFLTGRYYYRLVSVSDLKINPLEIPLISQPVRDAGIELTYVHDTRDNPADATHGSYSLVDTSVSSLALGSQANFVRAFGQNSTYYRLTPHVIFARNTQFGVESTYGALEQVTVSGEPVLTDEIPLAERFFAGGSDSIRAFSLNQAGPRDPDTGYPIGGNALFVNSLELRLPLRGGRYGLVFFDDAGNVYSSIDTMRLLKFTQPSLTDLNYTVDAAGFGLRYNTPIGPIRLDLSYVPNAPSFQFGLPGKPPEVQQLPRFQYFISIGQSF